LKATLLDLAGRLDASKEKIRSSPVVVGFDAFVDQVYSVVSRRTDPEHFERMPGLGEFGSWIAASAGRSGLREVVLTEETAGGCAVNQGDSLASLGFPVSAFLGGASDPALQEFRAKCHSVEELGIRPGRSSVYEFNDGKLMLCSFSHFSAVTPDFLRSELTRTDYVRRCAEASAIVLTSWSVYPHMTACWRFLQKEALAGITNRPCLFFDIADPASRTGAELKQMMGMIAGFEAIGPVTLSLNQNEARQMAEVSGLDPDSDSESLGSELRRISGITELGIHAIKWAGSSTAGANLMVDSAHTPTPRRSVGAGDRFNAGWLAGSLIGLPQDLRLLMGCANSGFFVRNGRSATLQELAGFVRDWAEGTIR
jgi:sugar/nucleoside kinase (ribokinase family)